MTTYNPAKEIDDLIEVHPEVAYLGKLIGAADHMVYTLIQKESTYLGSWQKRGGVGAFMMLARKMDRIENQSAAHHYDIFEAIAATINDDEGLLDDLRDLRNYLTLVECEVMRRINLFYGHPAMVDDEYHDVNTEAVNDRGAEIAVDRLDPSVTGQDCSCAARLFDTNMVSWTCVKHGPVVRDKDGCALAEEAKYSHADRRWLIRPSRA